MRVETEVFSYRSGSPRLNLKRAIKQEIDDVITHPRIDISLLSREEYGAYLRAEFLAKGWADASEVGQGRGSANPVMDLIKGGAGIKMGILSSSPVSDLLGFQAVYEARTPRIDVGVYIVGTSQFQRCLRKVTDRPWGGSTFGSAVQKFSAMSMVIHLPVCVIGLNALQTNVRKGGLKIDQMSVSDLKDRIFTFLEKTYGRPIDQNIRVMSSVIDIEFDGIMRLDGMDLVFQVALSRAEGILPSQVLADMTRNCSRMVSAYQTLAGQRAALRFILVGKFSPTYLKDVLGLQQNGDGMENGINVDYEIYSFEELGLADE